MGTVFLPRIVGPAVARDLILTSRRFSGEEAFALGLANRTAATPEETVQVAVQLADQIAQNGPLGVKGARVVIDQGLDVSLEEHIAISDKYRIPLNDSHDFMEALAAFEEKRKPQFQGR